MNVYPENDYRSYLQHHGILGQRCGVRRFQNKDGSLTSKGKKRYSSLESSEDQKNPKKKFNKDDYKWGNLSDEQKRKVKIAAATVGVLTLAAATAYLANKAYSNEFVDKVVSEGTNIHTIGANKNKQFNKAFYAAYKTGDRMRYKGMLGTSLLFQHPGQAVVYDYSHELSKDLKIPSPRKATNVMSEMFSKDHEFKSQVKSMLNQWGSDTGGPKQQALMRQAMDAMNKDKTDIKSMRKVYDAYNMMLVGHDNGGVFDQNHAKFYQTLKNLGYGAVIDVNDSKYSGYKSKAPLVIFDAQVKTQAAVKELGLDKALMNNIGAQALNNYNKYIAYAGAGVGASAAITVYDNKSRKR